MKRFIHLSISIMIVLSLLSGIGLKLLGIKQAQASGSVFVDGEPSYAQFTNQISYSFEHTSGTGENRLLLIGVAWGRSTGTGSSRFITSITFNDVPLLPIISDSEDPYNCVAIYRYPDQAPLEETAHIVIDLSSKYTNVIIGAINFAGVDYDAPFSSVLSISGETANPLINLQTKSGELVFDTVSTYFTQDQSLVANTNQTEVWNEFVEYDFNKLGAASVKTATSTLTTMSWIPTYPYEPWAIAAVSIKPAQQTIPGISGFVWIDQDMDGIQDSEEPGLPDVLVELIQDGNNDLFLSISTDSDGCYFIESPPSADYYPKFSHPTIDLAFTLQNQGSDDTLDSDVDANGLTSTFTNTTGVSHENIDAGLIMPDNPSLNTNCGLDLAIIIDSSLTTDENLNAVKTAFQNFTSSLLPATPTRIALIDFDTIARVWDFGNDQWDDTVIAENKVYWSNDLTTINSAIGSIQNDSDTNYDNALSDAHALFAFDREDNPDLIIFSTHSQPDSIGVEGISSSATEALTAAIQKAFYIKSEGIRILSLGIGSNFDQSDLTDISGYKVDMTPITDTDVITTDFVSLASALQALVAEMCGGTCTIHNIIDEDGHLDYDAEGNIIPEDDWITEDLVLKDWAYHISTSDGDLSLADGQANPALTGSDGQAIINFEITSTPSTFNLQESLPAGWFLFDVVCFNKEKINLSVTKTLETALVEGIPFATNEDILACYFYNYPSPTAVTFLSFTAKIDGESVLLEWETSSEINNLGFNIYREDKHSETKEKINPNLIPSQLPGGVEGAIYDFVDNSATFGESYTYWLEAIDFHMRVKDQYGPVTILWWQNFLPLFSMRH